MDAVRSPETSGTLSIEPVSIGDPVAMALLTSPVGAGAAMLL